MLVFKAHSAMLALDIVPPAIRHHQKPRGLTGFGAFIATLLGAPKDFRNESREPHPLITPVA